VDDQTHAMLRHLDQVTWTDAGSVMSPCKLRKTPDEVACIRTAQHINELAMLDAQALCRPGVRQTDLSGAFLRRVFELGASAGSVDPIWQVMSPTKELGPWTLHGDLAYPTSTTDRFLREGDVIWVDVGILWEGYASDYGRTWLTSAAPVPNKRQASQFRRWRGVVDAVLEVLKPGVSAHQLARTAIDANGGTRPWIEHFYLAHGVGTDSAEMPLIGTDLGEAFDETQIMEPGMVLVFEPVIWDEGAAGYRSEDIVVVTDTGSAMLSGSTYDPFQVAS
jgi:Xaa-Pro aminopeptidase